MIYYLFSKTIQKPSLLMGSIIGKQLKKKKTYYQIFKL